MRLGVAAAVVDGGIVAGDVSVDAASGRIEEVALEGGGSGVAVPGLVDLQVNGVGPYDFRSCEPEEYGAASVVLAAGGATAVQPTFHSQSVDAYERSLAVLGEVGSVAPPGCTFLPAHLEGPFLSTAWAGAHDPGFLCDPDPQVLDRLLAAGPVGFVTLAPELPGGLDTVGSLAGRGIVVSIGHTDADAARVRAAVVAGARHLSHCWNAHRRLTARDPGPAGVALASADLVVGLVADLAHVAAEVVQLTMRAAPGRVAVTTDSVALPAALDGHEGARPAVRRLADGTIAGGLSRPIDCLRNLVAIGTGLPAAVDACGGVQRRLLGLPDVRLVPGSPADLVVLDDALEPIRTLVAGTERWRV